MADLATPEFLAELKALYPSSGASGTEAILNSPWYLVAVVAFSASNKAVPVVFESVLAELKAAQRTEPDADKARAQRLHLARRFREALLQSCLLCGVPRTINSCIALNAVLADELRDTEVLRDTKSSLQDVAEKRFCAMYRETADTVQALLAAASPDLAWLSNADGVRRNGSAVPNRGFVHHRRRADRGGRLAPDRLAPCQCAA